MSLIAPRVWHRQFDRHRVYEGHGQGYDAEPPRGAGAMHVPIQSCLATLRSNDIQYAIYHWDFLIIVYAITWSPKFAQSSAVSLLLVDPGRDV